MKVLSEREFLTAISGEYVRKGGPFPFMGVSTDSRTLREGELFFALRGRRYDGHAFVAEAFRKGAWGAVVDRGYRVSEDLPERNIVAVKDTLKALGDLAAYYRRLFDMPVVAVSGSCGKTTTKEMLRSILTLSSRPVVSEGNYNNLIGLPNTLFKLREDHSVAVLELGINEGREEMGRLAEIAMPTVAILTNIGVAHLEGMEGIEGVRDAKLELFRKVEGRGCMVINGDDPMIVEGTRDMKGEKVTYGLKRGDVFLLSLEEGKDGMTYEISAFGRRLKGRVRVLGLHNISNLLGAVAVAGVLGVGGGEIVEGLTRFRPVRGRMCLIDLGSVKLIDDTYNANPTSMAASLKVLSDMGALRKVAILGDMLELGEKAPSFHFDLGRIAASLSVDLLYFTGIYGEEVRRGALSAGMVDRTVRIFEDKEGLWEDLRGELRAGDLMLVKASRAMAMEEIVEKVRGFVSSWSVKGSIPLYGRSF